MCLCVTAGGDEGTAVQLTDVFLMKTAVVLWFCAGSDLFSGSECSYVVIPALLLK